MPGTYEYLKILAKDPEMWIRLAAGAALERQGDPRGFPEVVRLLTDAPQQSRGMIRDLLISYAGKLRGRALTPEEIAQLQGPRAWSQWFAEHNKSKGLPAARQRSPAATPRGS